ncbi:MULTISPECIES: hypothetical protein [Enterobacterales]|jgi:hypothetical protein|uniref:hypothetical protein n=1 Tax=Enterobacterales TaxID=91347 RepID=UPI001C8CB8CF|nr:MULTISPECIES: hypothetical protein [Enterobacterales]EKS7113465.1 hypothetical protein [Enterobacter ludwigii]ELV2797900.1 hypothetical protein [Enterobacter ludwigii]MBX9030899.1 hypothetical protein [Enterobacter ludwigii]
MQPRMFIAFAIFLGSYLPLSMILLVQDYDKEKAVGNICLDFINNTHCQLPLQKPILSVSFFILCLFCFIFTWLALKLTREDGKHIKVLTVKHTPADLMNYVLPYIVSFMSIDYTQENKFIGFIIFLMWLFWLSYKSGQVILNPMLIVLNWRMYEITYRYPGGTDEFSGVVLSNEVLDPNKEYESQDVQSVIIINKRY